MKRSLLFQSAQVLQYGVLLCGMMLVFIPYTWMISDNFNFIFYFRNFSLTMIFVMLFVLLQAYYCNNTQMALSFGGTRKNWFFSSLVTLPILALLPVLFFFFVADPLAHQFAGLPHQPAANLLPLALCAAVFVACLGSTMGYVVARVGAKWMVITLIAIFLMGVFAGIFAALSSGFEKLLASITNPIFSLVVLALCVPCQFASWRMLRNMMVRG